MSVTPKIHLTAYEDRKGDFIFVAVPDDRGRYLRTDKSVVLRACKWCLSIPGEPCKGVQGYSGSTNTIRRTGGGLPISRSEMRSATDWPPMPDPVPIEWMGDAS